MPFDQKYDDATREAATARVLQRRATHPDDRHVITVVASEFNVGPQSLRAWVEAAAPAAGKPVRRVRRPRFSPVVTTTIERAPEGESPLPATAITLPAAAPARPVAAPAVATIEPAAAPVEPAAVRDLDDDNRVASLEAEAAALRRGNESLKNAMRVLLAP